MGSDSITVKVVMSIVALGFVIGGVQGEWSDLSGIEVSDIDKRAYAEVTGDSGVQIMDITDPAYPAPTGTVEGGFTPLWGASDVAVFEIANRTYALITTEYGSGVQIMDITDPTNLVPTATVKDDVDGFASLWGAGDIEIAEIYGRTYALVAGFYDNGVQIMDITNPTNPVPTATVKDDVGRFTKLNGTRDIEVTEMRGRTYALVAGFYSNNMPIMDITNPTNPVWMATATNGVNGFTALLGASDIEVTEIYGRTYALVAGEYSNSIQVIDITDPRYPIPANRVTDDTDGFMELDGAHHITIAEIAGGTYALVAAFSDNGVQIMDITDPTNPVPIAAVTDDADGFTELWGAGDIAVTDIDGRTYAIVTAFLDDGVQIMDITDPTNPVHIAAVTDDADGFTELWGANGIVAFNMGNSTYALVAATYDDGAQIMDITDPASPVAVSSIDE